jgi:nucleotide-binding universal stress UspA family protein
MSLFDTILTAVDFSDMSRDVLRFARRLAAVSPGAHLVVAHIVLDPLRQPYTVEAVGVDWVRLKEEWMADARQRLEELTTAEGLTPGSFSSVVVMGRPAEDIVAVARDRSADVIVIGTHGYGPVKHLILGSVAERVLRQAECPVLTVPLKSIERTGTS